MDNKPSRAPLWILALVVLVVILFMVRRPSGVPEPPRPPLATPTPTCVPLVAAPPWIQNVVVGQDACVNPECVTIRATGDTIQWSGFAGKTLSMEFTDELFSGMSSNSGKFTLRCAASPCSSGPVKLSMPPGTEKGYKYTQTLQSGSNQQCGNGRIIIKW